MSLTCAVHTTHVPTPLRTVVHHIQPLAMGGANVPENEVSTCDTGHYNIHRLLGDLIEHGKMRRGGARKERAFAQQGYDKWITAGKPGTPVFEDML